MVSLKQSQNLFKFYGYKRKLKTVRVHHLFIIDHPVVFRKVNTVKQNSEI